MPRSAFTADVRGLAAQAGKQELESVQDVRFDNETDEVLVSFKCDDSNTTVTVCILCGDLDLYPDSRHYFMTATDDSQSHAWAVNDVQQKLQEAGTSCTLLYVVREIISKLTHDIICIDSDDSDHEDAIFDTAVEDGPEDFPTTVLGMTRHRSQQLLVVDTDPSNTPVNHGPFSRPRIPYFGSRSTRVDRGVARFEIETGARRARIAKDLKAVCDAGYFFGVLGGMTGSDDNNIVAVSVKISTLGLSIQMMLAWDLDPDTYLVLLIRFSTGYIAYEPLLELSNMEAGLAFRVGKCTRYKPSALHAYSAFGMDCLLDRPATEVGAEDDAAAFSKILVSGELGRLMSDSFLTLMRLHDTHGLSWADTLSTMATQPTAPGDAPPTRLQSTSSPVRSLPLSAMQFAVDRLQNYTKYCQSCFAKLDKSWQSFKPTVCSRELCLYQHIQIGLTQYLEYEILCQPAVIDLLINFCYVALFASLNKPEKMSPMRKFPSGLRLFVPDLDNPHPGYFTRLDDQRFTMFLTSRGPADLFRKGNWVAVAHSLSIGDSSTPTMTHAVITDVDAASSVLYLKAAAPINGIPKMSYVLPYTKNIDSARETDKANLLLGILDTLPSVDYLRSQLQSPLVSSLKAVDGLSQSAAVLLEWIIATNRSCIMQITSQHLMVLEQSQQPRGPYHFGPPQGWLQFCFFHGSPDSEAQFEHELSLCRARNLLSNPAHPTLLAWHGSVVENWHSILRTGLDYQVVKNGRSYGDGVYFSHNFADSRCYSGHMTAKQWPKAVTDLQSVMSLNEIINAPASFRSSSPHYVVQQRNWSRCRFLFAQARSMVPAGWPQTQTTTAPLAANQGYVVQDPVRVAIGPEGDAIHIPLASMPPRASTADANGNSAALPTAPGHIGIQDATKTMDAHDLSFMQALAPQREVIVIDTDDDAIEITKVVDKRPIQISDDEDSALAAKPPSKKIRKAAIQPAREHVNEDVTPFAPGRLDHRSLRVLQPPSWGTHTAQRVLSSSLRDLQKVQAATPPPNLGWHIDFDRLENLFQWVVELHSFDNKIPLAHDMRRDHVNSIVMEMRFGPDYPMTPPLVRVIRPRFLPLMQGGGGHVTAGGAMCMELLTTTGWSPSYTLAAVLMQVHLALTTAQPPARLQAVASQRIPDYSIREAMMGYMRSAATHGWSVPKDMAMRETF